MKFSKLLVMSALWLVGFNANAADLIERTKPTMADVPEVPVEFQVGETYLLYNVTAEKFFTQGNTWGTRGCVGPKASAVLIKVAQYKVNDVWDGKTYEFRVEFSLCGKSTGVYKAVEALRAGDTVDLEGFLCWEEGARPHIISVTVK